MAEYIEAIRAGFVCDRCGKYVGALSPSRYVPPAYPIAFEDLDPEDEARALVEFEWHMLGMLRRGKFVLRHPERDGQCVSVSDWAREEDDDEDNDAAEDVTEA
jgi:hypothetical protein